MHIWISRCFVVSLSILLAATLNGCASKPTLSETKRVQALERKLRKQSARLQDLKERNFVLEKRGVNRGSAAATVPATVPASVPASAAVIDVATGADLGVSIADPNPVETPPKATASKAVASKSSAAISISPEKTGEHYLYSKVLETYRARNPREMETTLGLLLKSYPESVFADNALYLSGLMSFEKGDLSGAKMKFDRLLRDFPRSNKAVAALFAKASMERKIGRANEAKRGFLHVRDLFPGSPEAARVAVELKLIESASLKKREI